MGRGEWAMPGGVRHAAHIRAQGNDNAADGGRMEAGARAAGLSMMEKGTRVGWVRAAYSSLQWW